MKKTKKKALPPRRIALLLVSITLLAGMVFAATAAHTTITLLKDITVEDDISIAKELTFDLNGHTVTNGDKITAASGYEMTKSGDIWTVEKAPAVAKIGDVGYTSMQAALNASKAGDKVELLQDITISGNLSISKYIDIDLGGHTVTAGNYGILIDGAVKSLTNGTIKAKYYAVTLGYSSATSIDELNINANSGYWVIWNGANYASTIKNITGGSYIGVYDPDPNMKILTIGLYNTSKGTVTEISGGKFQGNGAAFQNYGTISSITDGIFCAKALYTVNNVLRISGDESSYLDIWAQNRPVSITGGTWANEGKKSGGSKLIPDDGYELVKGDLIEEMSNIDFYIVKYGKDPINMNNEYYWYTVEKAASQAPLDNVADISAAMETAKSGDTITIAPGTYYFGDGLTVPEGVSIASSVDNENVYLVVPVMERNDGTESNPSYVSVSYKESDPITIVKDKTYRYGVRVTSTSYKDGDTVDLSCGSVEGKDGCCACAYWTATDTITVSNQTIESYSLLSFKHDDCSETSHNIEFTWTLNSVEFSYTFKEISES